MGSNRIGAIQLRAALIELPAWLAEECFVWIRCEEDAGNGFRSADEAVSYAVEAMSGE